MACCLPPGACRAAACSTAPQRLAPAPQAVILACRQPEAPPAGCRAPTLAAAAAAASTQSRRHIAAAPALPRRPRRRVAAAAGGSEGGLGEEDAQPPQVLGDWRAFRAKLVAESGDGGWAARQAEDNRQLLQIQSPALAQEETWAHATGAPEVGGLLLATSVAPGMLGDEYWQVVVFLLQHGPQGSLGLILNRPTSLKMGRGRGGLPMSLDGMPELRDAFASSILYCGGYKAQHIVTLLHGQRRLEGAVEVIPGIYLGAHEAATAEVVTGGLLQTDFRFFAGCLAWEPGQLAREIAAGAWHTAACSRTLVLKQCLQLPVPLWREAMCLMGGRFAEEARQQQTADGDSDDD